MIDAEAALAEIMDPLKRKPELRSDCTPVAVIMLLDSCRWRHVIERGKAGAGGVERGHGISVAPVTRSLVGHACASGKQANDAPRGRQERNIQYTKALLQHLGTTSDVRNDLEAAGTAVREATANLTIKQVPSLISSLGLPCPHPLVCFQGRRPAVVANGGDVTQPYAPGAKAAGKRKRRERAAT